MGSRFGSMVLSIAIVGSLLLASCASAPPSPATSETGAAETKPYGSLITAMNIGAGNFDPQTATASEYGTQGAFIFDSLNYIGPGGKLTPGIAERSEISSDGLTHTYYIRKGVKFHDGSDLTAVDVKFSIERMLEPQVVHMNAGEWRQTVARIELKDNYTVAVHLKGPRFEPMKGELADSVAAVVPKKYIEEKGVEYFRSHPVGSGPWKLVKYEAGSRLELEAVDYHWRGTPKFKNLTVLKVLEPQTKVAMLKTGELDVAGVPYDSVATLKAAGVRVESYDADGYYGGWMFWDQYQPQKYVVGDIKIRQALQFAINSKEIADSMFGGYAAPYAMMYVSSTAYFYDPDQLKVAPYDPEGAKKLLAEAGYPNGFPLKIWDVGGGGLISLVAAALAGYERKIGVKADLAPIDYSALYRWVAPKPKPEIFDTIWVHLFGVQREFAALFTGYHSTKSVIQNLNMPELDALIDKVPMTTDPAEKKKIALEAAVLAQKQYSGLRIVNVYTHIAYSAKIGGWTRLRASDVSALMFASVTHAK